MTKILHGKEMIILQTLSNLFKSYDYKLICCNSATGANAFFVHNKFAENLGCPTNIRDIYNS